MRVRFKWSNYMNIFMHPLLGATPLALYRTMSRLKALPTIHFLPKFLFVIFMTLMNVPLIIVEKVYLYFNRNKRSKKDPVFIIGHPRSGTTHLQQLIVEDSRFYTPKLYQVLFPNYSNTFALLLNRLIEPFLPKKRPQDNVEIGLHTPQEEEFALAATSGISFINGFYYPKQFKEIIDETVLFKSEKDKKAWQKSLVQFVNRISTSAGDKQLILKSPANMGRIDAILEIYPNARFIHIQRDPLLTLQSTLHLFEKVLPQTSFQRIEEGAMIDNAFYMYETFLKAYRAQSANLSAKNLLEISHEAFISNMARELEKVYRFMGVNFSINTIDLSNYQNYKKNHHAALPDDLIKRLEALELKLHPTPPVEEPEAVEVATV